MRSLIDASTLQYIGVIGCEPVAPVGPVGPVSPVPPVAPSLPVNPACMSDSVTCHMRVKLWPSAGVTAKMDQCRVLCILRTFKLMKLQAEHWQRTILLKIHVEVQSVGSHALPYVRSTEVGCCRNLSLRLMTLEFKGYNLDTRNCCAFAANLWRHGLLWCPSHSPLGCLECLARPIPVAHYLS